MSEHKEGCFFSSGIDDSITCSKDGVFDDLGFPVNSCDDFPCKIIIDRTREENERERVLHDAAPLMRNALRTIQDGLKGPGFSAETLGALLQVTRAALRAAGDDNDS